MEQSCDDSSVRAEEIEVANILLELSHLIFESESRLRFRFTWGAKRKRSTASEQKVAAISLPARKLSPPLLQPPYPPPSLLSNVVGSTFETEGPTEKVLTSSPATPLSFPPSESDEKPLLPKKKPSVNNLKKKKEQLLEIIEEFTQRNELLKKDIENKKRFLDEQKAESLELKSKKQKLCQSLPKEEEPCLVTSNSLNLELELTHISMEIENATTTSSCQYYHHHHHQQISTNVYQPPLIMDQTASNSKPETDKNSEYPFGRMICFLPSTNIGGLRKLHDNVCPPLGPFDLNVSVEETVGSFGFSSLISTDLETAATKARAAQARLKRMQICRSKNYNAACKARLPF